MGLTRFAIKTAIKIPKIDSFNNYLFVGPHPDDIEIGAGATIAKLVSLGKKVSYVICTDGRFGIDNNSGITSEELITIRKNESLNAAKALGVENVYFLNLCDGNQYEYKELTTALAKVINMVKPDIIFGPDPDVKSECHQDHLNVGRACKELANFANNIEVFRNYVGDEVVKQNVEAIALYMTASPNKFFKTTGFFKKQLSAIFDNHLSQYPKESNASSSLALYLKLRTIEFGFRSFHINAEGFRVLAKTHMHCLPEMGK